MHPENFLKGKKNRKLGSCLLPYTSLTFVLVDSDLLLEGTEFIQTEQTPYGEKDPHFPGQQDARHVARAGALQPLHTERPRGQRERGGPRQP